MKMIKDCQPLITVEKEGLLDPGAHCSFICSTKRDHLGAKTCRLTEMSE